MPTLEFVLWETVTLEDKSPSLYLANFAPTEK